MIHLSAKTLSTKWLHLFCITTSLLCQVTGFKNMSTSSTPSIQFFTSLEKENGARSQLQSASIHKSQRQKTLDQLLQGYDPRIPPNYEEDFPVKVLVQLHITNIDSISESNMDFSIGMFLRQKWNDTRLKYTALPRLKALELDSRMMDKVWVPDLFIANEKQAHFHVVTVPNKLMHIYPEGSVHYSVRITATLKCSMDLRKYPLDNQTCNVIMESYGYSTDNLVFGWNPLPVTHDNRLVQSQFQFGAMETLRCDKAYVGVNYTCIMLQFEMVRSFGYYIIQVYIPSILIVILSWVSFWLDIDAVPARISLGLLTVLTMTTQSAGARSALPRVSYVKGIDVWMAACLIFVFSALIEFAYVNVNSRVERRRRASSHPASGSMSSDMLSKNGREIIIEKKGPPLRRLSMFTPSREKARTTDRFSRFAFPTSFIVFNTAYWSVYTFWTPDPSDVQ
ncbi:glycine receptor subunit alpha-3-like isoform X2 [Mya arenaria]|uniref:glycine receptor subunit alpha-3-like isoform X2 n=1 Tax=Mya arenaria TaxID=6604 RepID=UPI0022E8F53C|nr:glycine receptor subunit alpha-3-like isoform X2 [Mya arenaria]